jgi:hypothetical protein
VSEILTSETFKPHVGERFELQPEGGDAFDALLESCDETTYGSREQWLKSIDRVPFSLIFAAPGGDLVPQGTFTVRHEQLGETQIFLVPLAPGKFEAVFS